MALLGLLVVDQGQIALGRLAECPAPAQSDRRLPPVQPDRLRRTSARSPAWPGWRRHATLSPSVLLAALAAWALLPLGARGARLLQERAMRTDRPPRRLRGRARAGRLQRREDRRGPAAAAGDDGRGHRPLLRHERARAHRARRGRSSWRAARSRSGSRRRGTRSRSRMLPEEPKDIRAIYVSDMAKAPNWDKPGATNWVDAKQASFVIGSRMKGGMGGDEAVPFSDRALRRSSRPRTADASWPSPRCRRTMSWAAPPR